MLQITINSTELFDDKTQEFIHIKEQILCLEHSLLSISKWESKWHKPYLTKTNKTIEETIDYIKCMTLTSNVRPEVYLALSNKNFDEIANYIEDPMTATWFSSSDSDSKSNQQITNELIYYWMFTLQIPKECEKWHIARLMTLIRVFNEENKTSTKSNNFTNDMLTQRRALNEARRKQLNTKG